MESLFTFLSYSPGPFWLLILFLPKNRTAMLVVDCFLILLSAIFAFQTVPVLQELLPLIAKPEFVPISEFLGSDRGIVGSWNHMILGDLWIGRWVAHDSLQSKYPLLIRVVFIIPILLFGPLGLFCYFIFRIISRRRVALTEV
ncbi:MAG: DUF4281 domain-containing protein [Verrucomicrobiales bacterium]|jgi:hypothetical protein|nr:DUF4281 domain-containing protein [Verrucomicrobiales bacterium]